MYLSGTNTGTARTLEAIPAIGAPTRTIPAGAFQIYMGEEELRERLNVLLGFVSSGLITGMKALDEEDASTDLLALLAVTGEPQQIATAGAIDVTHATTLVTADAAAQAMTLANGKYAGQRKTIVLAAQNHAGDYFSVTCTSGPAVFSLTQVWDFVVLEWSSTDAAWKKVLDGRASVGGTTQQALVGAGAINLTTNVTRITANGAGQVCTLANGAYTGQHKVVILDSTATPGVDTSVITPTLGGPWTLDTAGEWLYLEWIPITGWNVIMDGQSPVTDDSLTGAHAAVIANDNLTGGIPVIHVIAVPDGGANVDLVLTEKTEIVDCHAIKTTGAGGAADTVQLQTGAGVAISDAMDLNAKAEGDIIRAASLAAATRIIAAGDTLRAHPNAGAGDNSVLLIVFGVKRA